MPFEWHDVTSFFPLLTSSGIPRFWMNPCQTGLIRSHHRPSPLLQNPSHSSQRSPPHPFWALGISCAKLLICLVTSQCFLHGTEGEISTLPRAVNHSALPLVHWYDHYSIRLHSNWPHLLVISIRGWGLFTHYFVFLKKKRICFNCSMKNILKKMFVIASGGK